MAAISIKSAGYSTLALRREIVTFLSSIGALSTSRTFFGASQNSSINDQNKPWCGKNTYKLLYTNYITYICFTTLSQNIRKIRSKIRAKILKIAHFYYPFSMIKTPIIKLIFITRFTLFSLCDILYCYSIKYDAFMDNF